jgi:hypothetical protein
VAFVGSDSTAMTNSTHIVGRSMNGAISAIEEVTGENRSISSTTTH